jgi:sugar (pentulose or hexulose) kinase
MSEKYLLGVDVGTSVVKAVLFNDDGTQVAIASQSVVVDSPKPGWAEQDMMAVWEITASVIQEAISSVDAEKIVAVGITGQGDGAWLLDQQKQPLIPAPLWNDGRAADIVLQWEQNGVLHDAFPSIGTVLWPGSSGPILAWLKKNQPEVYARIGTVFYCKDWVKYKLTGVICTDETDGSIPFMKLSERIYNEKQAALLDLDDIQEKLAPIVPSHEVIGNVTTEAADATGLHPGTPVVSGMLDVVANALGVGVMKGGQSFCTLGTTAIIGIVLDESVFEPEDTGASVCYSVPGHWLRVLGTMSGTPGLEWYLSNMGEIFYSEAEDATVYDVLEERLVKVPVGSGGVIFHPFLQGERMPFLNPNARGAFFGLSNKTTRAHLARAVYEGIAYSIQHCFDAIGADVDEVMLSGGGANSAAWCQILADQLDAKIVVPAGEQFGALGAAIAAGVGVGVFDSYQTAVSQCVAPDRVYSPNPENVEKYRAWFDLYKNLIEAMEPFWSARQKLLDKFDI